MTVDNARAASPIHRLFKMAVWAGAETAVRLHIARGDDPNARDETGLTPLMIAAARNKSAVCRLLADAGVDLTALDPSGRSALEIAVANGALEAAAVIEMALSQQQRIAAAPTEAPPESPSASPSQAPISGGLPEGAREVAIASTNERGIEAPASRSTSSPKVSLDPALSRSALDAPPAWLDSLTRLNLH